MVVMERRCPICGLVLPAGEEECPDCTGVETPVRVEARVGVEATARDLTTVYSGDPAEAEVLKNVLASEGFFTFLANQNIKAIDPFITGGRVFDVDLQVPRDQAESALARIRELRSGRRSRDRERAPSYDELNDEEKLVALGVFGRRLRWSSVLLLMLLLNPLLFLPGIVAYLVAYVVYVRRAARLDDWPRAHVVTLLSLLVALGYAAALVIDLL